MTTVATVSPPIWAKQSGSQSGPPWRESGKSTSTVAPTVIRTGRSRARELEVLTLLARGVSNKIIGKDLRISETTVKTHLIHIFAKLGVDDRTAAVTVAMERGILRLEK